MKFPFSGGRKVAEALTGTEDPRTWRLRQEITDTQALGYRPCSPEEETLLYVWGELKDAGADPAVTVPALEQETEQALRRALPSLARVCDVDVDQIGMGLSTVAIRRDGVELQVAVSERLAAFARGLMVTRERQEVGR